MKELSADTAAEMSPSSPGASPMLPSAETAALGTSLPASVKLVSAGASPMLPSAEIAVLGTSLPASVKLVSAGASLHIEPAMELALVAVVLIHSNISLISPLLISTAL